MSHVSNTHLDVLRRCCIALACTAAVVCTAATAEPRTFHIDPDHFSIGFLVEHVGYAKTLGQFREARGEFVYDEQTQELRSGRVEIQANSVFTDHEKRDEHLRGGDFLDADDHPEIVFQASSYQPKGDRQGTLKGELTLLGTTRPVNLDVTINKGAVYPFGHKTYTLGISARTTIKRSEWGMTYAVENGLVGDEVELIFELEAIRQ